MNVVCRRCGREGLTTEAVRLWDRCVYCRPCVDEASPSLFDYARDHDVLEELVEGAARQSLRRSLIAWIAMKSVPIVFVLMVFVGQWRIRFHDDRWGYLFIIAGIGLVFAKFLIQRRIAPDSATLRIAATDGAIECTHGDRQIVRAPLAEWSWSFLAGSPIEPLLVLTIAGPSPTGDSDERFACGYTDETRSRWIGFLKLAGVREEVREGPGTRDRGPER